MVPILQRNLRMQKLRGVFDAAESSSRVSLPPRSQAQRCHCHREVILGGVNDTAESNMIYLIFKIS